MRGSVSVGPCVEASGRDPTAGRLQEGLGHAPMVGRLTEVSAEGVPFEKRASRLDCRLDGPVADLV